MLLQKGQSDRANELRPRLHQILIQTMEKELGEVNQ
jgi:hypothetical protein